MVIKKSFQRTNSNLQVIWKGCLDFCVTILLISSKILPSIHPLHENIPQNAKTCCQFCRLIYENKSYYNGN